jgi:hypothetical protein
MNGRVCMVESGTEREEEERGRKRPEKRRLQPFLPNQSEREIRMEN